MDVRVYNVSGEVEDLVGDSVPPSTSPVVQQMEETEPQSQDISNTYGSHIAKVLTLMKETPDKQVALIRKLNAAIHRFIVSNRS